MKKICIFMLCLLTIWFSTIAFADPIKISLAHSVPETFSLHLGYVRFKELVESRSNGEILVNIYSGGALGGDRQAIEGVNIGTIQMCLAGSISMGPYDPRFYIFDFPFLFDNYEMVDKIIHGKIGKKLTIVLPGTKIRVINWIENGFRNISNNKIEIKTIEDMRGLKIRAMETPVHIKAFEALGAVPTTLPFPEVYSALQTKLIDAQENANSLFVASKYYEVQKFYTIPGPIFLLDQTVINEDFFQSLSPEHQKIITEAAVEAGEFQRKYNRKANAEILSEEFIKEHGMKVTYLTPEAIEEFKKATVPVYEEFKNKIGVEFMNEVLTELGRPIIK